MNSNLTMINIPLVEDISNDSGNNLIQNLRSILGVQSVETKTKTTTLVSVSMADSYLYPALK